MNIDQTAPPMSATVFAAKQSDETNDAAKPSRWSIRVFIASTGERMVFLLRGRFGLPDQLVARYSVLELRARGLAWRSMRNSLEGVARGIDFFTADGNDDLAVMVAKRLPSSHELSELAQYMRKRRSKPKSEKEPSEPLARASAHYSSFVEYLLWLHEEACEGHPRPEAMATLRMDFRLRASRKQPIAERGSRGKPRLGLTKPQRNQFQRIIVPGAPGNPFRGTAVRNFVLLNLSFNLGMRSGELLGLRIQDFSFTGSHSRVTIAFTPRRRSRYAQPTAGSEDKGTTASSDGENGTQHRISHRRAPHAAASAHASLSLRQPGRGAARAGGLRAHLRTAAKGRAEPCRHHQPHPAARLERSLARDGRGKRLGPRACAGPADGSHGLAPGLENADRGLWKALAARARRRKPSRHAAPQRAGRGFRMNAYVTDRTGFQVDTSSQIWRLRDGVGLNFKPLFKRRAELDRDLPRLEALQRYFRHAITTSEPGSLRAELSRLSFVLRRKEVCEAMLQPNATFMVKADAAMKAQSWSEVVRISALVTCRKWYAFAVDEGIEGFDADAVFAMRATMIGGTSTGVAVRRLDPDDGPLHEAEATALEHALETAFVKRSLPISDIAAGLIFTLLGPNPENLRRLNESDLETEIDEAGRRYLNVPRIKKGFAFPRQEFKRRPIEPKLFAVLEALIEDNKQRFPEEPIDDGSGMKGRPLFAWSDPNSPGRPKRHGKGWFCNCVKALSAALGLDRFDPTSDVTEPLRLVPRRLRYTFAKRQVIRHHATPDVLADLLDHSSIQTVLVYYDPGMELVPSLDRALGDRLAPFVKVAMGRARAPRRLDEVLLNSLFDAAPGACLTCQRFRPASADGLEAIAARIAEAKKSVRSGIGTSQQSRALFENVERLDVRVREFLAALNTPGGPR